MVISPAELHVSSPQSGEEMSLSHLEDSLIQIGSIRLSPLVTGVCTLTGGKVKCEIATTTAPHVESHETPKQGTVDPLGCCTKYCITRILLKGSS